MVAFGTKIVQCIVAVCDWILQINHGMLFWLLVIFSAVFYSLVAAVIASIAGLLAWLASMKRRPGQLAKYQGPLDLLLGRSSIASTLTPEMPANNNVSIVAYGDDLVLAYRKAETHFASASAQIIVATSKNLEDWTIAWTHLTGEDDLREVLLWELNGKLFLNFAKLEPYKRGFRSKGMHWTSTTDLKVWSDPAAMGRDTEITWDIKVREEDAGPVAYKVGYIGNHYDADALLTVIFERSTDGVSWKPVGSDLGVYVGGVCEVSFAFTAKGDLVAIGRNEDGDHSGFGTQLFFAQADSLGTWIPLTMSLPYRFDSPRLVMMEGELVLFARYAAEVYGCAPAWLPMNLQRMINLITYSARPKSAAAYHVCLPDAGCTWPKDPIRVIRFFEDCFGDTGFFSVAKYGNSGEWAVANYASSCHSHASWFYGQLSPTDVFVCRCLPIRK